MTTDNKQCLFFDAQGRGPSVVRLIERAVREERDGDQIVVPRAFGLCWEVTGPLFFVEDGGFVLTDEVATWLRDQLTAWLDAPRLAARKTPTVVAERDGIRLLTTSAGEWGIADDESPAWLSCEAEARYEFRAATGAVSCESCARFIDHDDACVDDDGIYTCADETACSASCAAKESAK